MILLTDYVSVHKVVSAEWVLIEHWLFGFPPTNEL